MPADYKINFVKMKQPFPQCTCTAVLLPAHSFLKVEFHSYHQPARHEILVLFCQPNIMCLQLVLITHTKKKSTTSFKSSTI